ncbi:MAG: hypothetical protein QNJ56_10960 [Gammaproteobacteria bacterium]|nr:hypothetical protein [Gammaproteobacteria bacterium]
MGTKLVQKDLIKGTQEFELLDDAVNIHIKSPFKKEESLTVMLAVLNPEPVITKSRLEFTSRVNNEALISLYLAKPNAEEFNTFVSLLKQKAQDEFKAFAGLKTDTTRELEGNVYDEPPEFDTTENANNLKQWKPVNQESLEESIRMLQDYVGGDEISPLLAALKSLLSDPENVEIRKNVFKEFEALGPGQGAVLTYAPYVGILMSGDPYESF